MSESVVFVNRVASNRARCKQCNASIDKGSLRLGVGKRQASVWYHVDCFPSDSKGYSVSDIEGIEKLSAAEKKEVDACFGSAAMEVHDGVKGKKRGRQPNSKSIHAASKVSKKRKLGESADQSSAVDPLNANTAVPLDVSKLTVAQLKEKLTERGETDLSGKKDALQKRLQAILDGATASALSPSADATSSAKKRKAAVASGRKKTSKAIPKKEPVATPKQAAKKVARPKSKKGTKKRKEESEEEDEDDQESASDDGSNSQPTPAQVKSMKSGRGSAADCLNDDHRTTLKELLASKNSGAIKNGLMEFSIPLLKEVARLNDMTVTGTKGDLIARIADAMLNGALPRCPSCSGGRLKPSGFGFKCPGFYDDDRFVYCHYTTVSVVRNPFTVGES